MIWFCFYMKRDQREKRYFYKICRFFFKFLIGFVYLRQKKIGVYRTSAVRPVVTLFRLSDTLLNFARTGVFISEL